MTWFVGVDFGRNGDRTAIAAVESVPAPPDANRRLPRPFLDVRFLDRLPLGMPYPEQISRLAGLLEHDELGGARLAVDATGVGVAVADLMREQLRSPFTEIVITGGAQVIVDGSRQSVPKRDLISRLAVAMQARRLRVSPGLPDAEALRSELANFGVKISDSGSDSYGSRTGHDDLVLAVSYAVWVASSGGQGDAFLESWQRRAAREGIQVGSACRDALAAARRARTETHHASK